MPCAAFEDLLLDYQSISPADRRVVDQHVATCADCGEYLETALQLDLQLAGLYGAVEASPAFESAVRSRAARDVRLPKLSFLPEVLDFIGWSALLAGLAWFVLRPPIPRPDLTPQLLIVAALAAAAIAIPAAVWAGMRSYSELKQ